MNKIAFAKYTCYGNNFVIVDNTLTPSFGEPEMSQFAYEATNTHFGVGCDNLLIVQRMDKTTLEAIQQYRGYWNVLPDPQGAEFIFRMFEPDGEEAFCCGNGLMCVASYLSHQYGIRSARIMTEIPFNTPRSIGIGSTARASWARLARPRRVPPEIAGADIREPAGEVLDFVDNLEVHFRGHDLAPYTDSTTLSISGFLVFTGEPHLVIFPDEGFSESGLVDTLFDDSPQTRGPRTGDRRENFGSWLINRIGSYVNTNYQDQFPAGLNVNFARVLGASGPIEYRCFERGINRETLACGTGALAVAYVAEHLGATKATTISVLPDQCRRHQPEAAIELQDRGSGWMITGHPLHLLDGTFMLHASRRPPKSLDLAYSVPGPAGVVRVHTEYGDTAVAST